MLVSDLESLRSRRNLVQERSESTPIDDPSLVTELAVWFCKFVMMVVNKPSSRGLISKGAPKRDGTTASRVQPLNRHFWSSAMLSYEVSSGYGALLMIELDMNRRAIKPTQRRHDFMPSSSNTPHDSAIESQQ